MATLVVHVDMDCFFVSVVVRKRPDLIGKPVAVCHSSGGKNSGTSEISSANYEARKFGVKNGMFLREARRLCPDLLLVQYDFQGYEQVAGQVYGILHRYSRCVQALSCDEAFLELEVPEVLLTARGSEGEKAEKGASGVGVDIGGDAGVELLQGPEAVVRSMRREIEEATGCTASAGIGPNPLLARLATKKAKPNGQLLITQELGEAFLEDLPVADLHGVGWVTSQKLEAAGLKTCRQLKAIPKEDLQRDFGTKTGEMLWRFCRGQDTRRVAEITGSSVLRKSIGVEVNYGVRFRKKEDAHHFIGELVEEVVTRLRAEGAKGQSLCLKVKTRHPEADPEPAKFMGCGWCIASSRTASLGGPPTDDSSALLKAAMQLFEFLSPDPVEIRGMGLQVMKLQRSGDSERAEDRGQGRLTQLWGRGSAKKSSLSAVGIAGNGSEDEVEDEDLGRESEKPRFPPGMRGKAGAMVQGRKRESVRQRKRAMSLGANLVEQRAEVQGTQEEVEEVSSEEDEISSFHSQTPSYCRGPFTHSTPLSRKQEVQGTAAEQVKVLRSGPDTQPTCRMALAEGKALHSHKQNGLVGLQATTHTPEGAGVSLATCDLENKGSRAVAAQASTSALPSNVQATEDAFQKVPLCNPDSEDLVRQKPRATVAELVRRSLEQTAPLNARRAPDGLDKKEPNTPLRMDPRLHKPGVQVAPLQAASAPAQVELNSPSCDTAPIIPAPVSQGLRGSSTSTGVTERLHAQTLPLADAVAAQRFPEASGSLAGSMLVPGGSAANDLHLPDARVAEQREPEQNARHTHGLQLPPFSQVDVSVLDSLPPFLRREIEAAYKAELREDERPRTDGVSIEPTTQANEGPHNPDAAGGLGHDLGPSGSAQRGGQAPNCNRSAETIRAGTPSSTERLSHASTGDGSRGSGGRHNSGQGESGGGRGQGGSRGRKRGAHSKAGERNQQQTLEGMMMRKHRHFSSSGMVQHQRANSVGSGLQSMSSRQQHGASGRSSERLRLAADCPSEASAAAPSALNSNTAPTSGTMPGTWRAGRADLSVQRHELLSRGRYAYDGVMPDEVVEEWDGRTPSQPVPFFGEGDPEAIPRSAPRPRSSGNLAAAAAMELQSGAGVSTSLERRNDEGGTHPEACARGSPVLPGDCEREALAPTGLRQVAELPVPEENKDALELEPPMTDLGSQDGIQHQDRVCQQPPSVPPFNEETRVNPAPSSSRQTPGPVSTRQGHAAPPGHPTESSPGRPLAPESFTQVDPAVFSELGPDLQEELRRHLPTHRTSSTSNARRSGGSSALDALPGALPVVVETYAAQAGGSEVPYQSSDSSSSSSDCAMEEEEEEEATSEPFDGTPSTLPSIVLKKCIRQACNKGKMVSSGGDILLSAAMLRWRVQACWEAEQLQLQDQHQPPEIQQHAARSRDDVGDFPNVVKDRASQHQWHQEAMKCCNLLQEHLCQILSTNLKETGLLLRALRRLAHRLPFWQIVLESLEPRVQGLILDTYGGHLGFQ